jgi:carbon-monoxide dehydrogenase catalytic subunit
MGVCGKDKDILAIQSLLRLVIKGTMAYLDQVSDFAGGVEAGEIAPDNAGQADQILKEIQSLFENGDSQIIKELPEALVDSWKAIGICPEGLAKDLFKASQKLEGGISGLEETLLWAFKTALLGCMAQRLHGKLTESVFGDIVPTEVEVNLGVLQTETPNIIIYGQFSPILKQKIAKAAQEKNIGIMGVCSDPLLPPFRFSPATTYGSQEIPLMTGAVDLIVAGDQFVNPSLVNLSKDWKVTLIPANGLKRNQDLDTFARKIVEQAEKAFDNRQDIPRDIPDVKESAVMGFSMKNVDADKIVEALNSGKIKGITIFSGSNNVKYTQDNVIVTMAREFLANDVLCISEGESSVCLAKYGLLNPRHPEKTCGKGLTDLLSSLGENIPSILDWNGADFLPALLNAEKKELKEYPIIACFAEANRSMDVAKAMWTVAMGVSTYFWPCLPVTGSPNAMTALSDFCNDKFGAKLHVITEKMDPQAKADLFLRTLKGPIAISGKSWE